MKRNLILLAVYMLFGITVCTGGQQAGTGSAQETSRRVATALDHLTVLEYEEPIAQAVLGSSTFQVEWQDNKIFVKPLKSSASTNLIVWTASGQQFSYELSVADVTAMDGVIHVSNPKRAPAPDESAKLDQLAAMAVTRTLLEAEPVDSGAVKTPKDAVGVRIQQVFRDKTTLFIRYSVENHTTKAYRVTAPTLFELHAEHPGISLASLKDKQLDPRTIEKLGAIKQVSVPCAPASEESDIAPGTSKQGLIAVRQSADWPAPTVVQVVFAPNVKAIMVL